MSQFERRPISCKINQMSCHEKLKIEGVEHKDRFDNLDYGTFLTFCRRKAMGALGNDTCLKIATVMKNL